MRIFLITLSILLTVNIHAQDSTTGYALIQRDTINNDTFPNFNHWEMYRMYNCDRPDFGYLERHKKSEPQTVLFKLLSMADSAYHGKSKVKVDIGNGEVSIDSSKSQINLKCKNQSKVTVLYSYQIPETKNAVLANLDMDNNRLVLNFYDFEAMKLGKVPPILKRMIVKDNVDLLCPL